MKAHPNDDLFAFLDKAGTFVLANLLWVVLSIPLVTLPAATAGLFATMSLWTRGKPPEVFRDFFGGMRQHWKKAYVIAVIDVFVAGLVLLNFSIFRFMNMSQPLTLLSQSVTLFVAVTAMMMNLYLWPLLVTVDDLPLCRLLETALKLVFVHPFWSFLMLVLSVIIFAVSALLPAAVFVLFSFSAFALVVNQGAWRVIRGYLREEAKTP